MSFVTELLRSRNDASRYFRTAVSLERANLKRNWQVFNTIASRIKLWDLMRSDKASDLRARSTPFIDHSSGWNLAQRPASCSPHGTLSRLTKQVVRFECPSSLGGVLSSHSRARTDTANAHYPVLERVSTMTNSPTRLFEWIIFDLDEKTAYNPPAAAEAETPPFPSRVSARFPTTHYSPARYHE